MDSYLKARVLQDLIRGLTVVNSTVKNGIPVAIELGLPSLKEEASELLGDKPRSGICRESSPDTQWEAGFGESHMEKGAATTEVTIRGALWKVRGAIPSQLDGPTNYSFGEVSDESNQCLPIHFPAGIAFGARGLQSSKQLAPLISDVFGDSRSLRSGGIPASR